MLRIGGSDRGGVGMKEKYLDNVRHIADTDADADAPIQKLGL